MHVASLNSESPGAATVTVRADGTGLALPLASCTVTVTAAEHAPAWALRAGVVKARRAAAPATIVSPCVAGISPAGDTVTITTPSAVPRKKNDAVAPAAGTVGMPAAIVHDGS